MMVNGLFPEDIPTLRNIDAKEEFNDKKEIYLRNKLEQESLKVKTTQKAITNEKKVLIRKTATLVDSFKRKVKRLEDCIEGYSTSNAAVLEKWRNWIIEKNQQSEMDQENKTDFSDLTNDQMHFFTLLMKEIEKSVSLFSLQDTEAFVTKFPDLSDDNCVEVEGERDSFLFTPERNPINLSSQATLCERWEEVKINTDEKTLKPTVLAEIPQFITMRNKLNSQDILIAQLREELREKREKMLDFLDLEEKFEAMDGLDTEDQLTELQLLLVEMLQNQDLAIEENKNKNNEIVELQKQISHLKQSLDISNKLLHQKQTEMDELCLKSSELEFLKNDLQEKNNDLNKLNLLVSDLIKAREMSLKQIKDQEDELNEMKLRLAWDDDTTEKQNMLDNLQNSLNEALGVIAVLENKSKDENELALISELRIKISDLSPYQTLFHATSSESIVLKAKELRQQMDYVLIAMLEQEALVQILEDKLCYTTEKLTMLELQNSAIQLQKKDKNSLLLLTP